jgi:hypothetical protein
MEVDRVDSLSSDATSEPDLHPLFPSFRLPPKDYVRPPTSQSHMARARSLLPHQFGTGSDDPDLPPGVISLADSSFAHERDYLELELTDSEEDLESDGEGMAIEGDHPHIPIYIPDSDQPQIDRPPPITLVLDSDDDIYEDRDIPMTVAVSDSESDVPIGEMHVISDSVVIPDTVAIPDDTDAAVVPGAGVGYTGTDTQPDSFRGKYTAASFSKFDASWLE